MNNLIKAAIFCYSKTLMFENQCKLKLSFSFLKLVQANEINLGISMESNNLRQIYIFVEKGGINCFF